MVNNGTKVNMGSEARRLREQHELKRRIIAAAREIARTEGWGNVTLRKIADRVEYTHAALYSYFANKEQLLLEVLREGFQLLALDLENSSAAAETPLIAFRRFVHAYWAFAWRHPELYRVMYGLDGISFGVSETWNEGTRIGELAAGVVERLLVAKGKPVERIETKVLLCWSELHGLIALSMAGRIPGTPETLTVLVDQIIIDLSDAWQVPAEPITEPTSNS
jgi:AcrR family transcriptional regulator